MRSYWVLFVIYIKDYLVYRLKIVATVSNTLIGSLIMAFVLTKSGINSILPIHDTSIWEYLLFSNLIFLFTKSNVDSYVKQAIQSGELANHLIKPMSFWKISTLKELSSKAVRFLVSLPIWVMVVSLFNTTPTINVSEVITFSFALILTLLLGFVVSFLIGVLAFYIEEVWGIQNLKEVSIVFLGGIIVPYQIFPEKVSQVLVFTPFPYIANWPLRVGFTGNSKTEFLVSSVWFICIFLLSLVLWKRGLKRYEGFGV